MDRFDLPYCKVRNSFHFSLVSRTLLTLNVTTSLESFEVRAVGNFDIEANNINEMSETLFWGDTKYNETLSYNNVLIINLQFRDRNSLTSVTTKAILIFFLDILE